MTDAASTASSFAGGTVSGATAARAKSRVAVSPAASVNSGMEAGEKPAFCTCRRYAPAATSAKVKRPSASVAATRMLPSVEATRAREAPSTGATAGTPSTLPDTRAKTGAAMPNRISAAAAVFTK